jgi:hypothetical protein
VADPDPDVGLPVGRPPNETSAGNQLGSFGLLVGVLFLGWLVAHFLTAVAGDAWGEFRDAGPFSVHGTAQVVPCAVEGTYDGVSGDSTSYTCFGSFTTDSGTVSLTHAPVNGTIRPGRYDDATASSDGEIWVGGFNWLAFAVMVTFSVLLTLFAGFLVLAAAFLLGIILNLRWPARAGRPSSNREIEG